MEKMLDWPEQLARTKVLLYYCSPSKILSNYSCVVLGDDWALITSPSIYRISKVGNQMVVYYKINKNGKNVLSKYIFAANENFFKIFLLFFENESFRRKILKVIEANKSQNKFLKIFEELNNFCSSKIEFIKKQDFDQATIARENEQKSLGELEKQLKELFGDNFKGIMNYIVYHLDDMIHVLKQNQDIKV